MEKIIEFVKPLYTNKDSMHNFKHILRIKRRVYQLKKGHQNIDKNKLNFLIYFHGLSNYVRISKNALSQLKIPKEYIKALYRHTKKPISIEEKLVSDANLLEAVGLFGIKKSLQVGKERKQTTKETLKIMNKNIRKIRFYTKIGKRLGNPGIKIIKEFLNKKR